MFNALRNQFELVRDVVWRPNPTLTENNLPDLSGKVYVVTGATAGIGLETVKLLLKAGAKVWALGRTEAKLAKAKQELVQEFGPDRVRVLQAKFEDPKTIAQDIQPLLKEEKELHGVIHNAGMNYRGSYFTEEGYLDLIVVNVISPWVLQQHLDPLVLAAAKTAPKDSVRIVWIASAAHYFSPGFGGIDWDNLNNENINGRFGFGIYGQTKAFNIYEAYLWAEHHRGSGVISVSAHPGTLESDIRRYRADRARNMNFISRPTIYGAYAEIAVLLDKDITESQAGQYYIPFGGLGRVRPDVWEAIQSPRGEKCYNWLQEQAANVAASAKALESPEPSKTTSEPAPANSIPAPATQ